MLHIGSKRLECPVCLDAVTRGAVILYSQGYQAFLVQSACLQCFPVRLIVFERARSSDSHSSALAELELFGESLGNVWR